MTELERLAEQAELLAELARRVADKIEQDVKRLEAVQK
jgi:hypothetical protein